MPRAKRNVIETNRKGLKAETSMARQLFLYGNGDGKRIVNVLRLAELTGVTAETLRYHIPHWEKEVEEILQGSTGTGYVLSLSAKDLQLHNSDMKHLRDDLEAVKWEMDRLDETISMLEKFVREFRLEDDPEAAARALKLLDAYVRASGCKTALRNSFLSLQKQWTSLSGIVDLKDIQASAEKELQRGRAKLQLKTEGATQVRDVTPAADAANMLRDS